ncbi:MAG: hypothetical protein NTZ94_06065 [Verrucomicrobia bacterium]|nr:hypothetical protein [Verrucomicrobiota bacterium]
MNLFFPLIAFFLFFAGCTDPQQLLRAKAITIHQEWMSKPEIISDLRKKYDIPETFVFKGLKLAGDCITKDNDYCLFEWKYTFLKNTTEYIYITDICYFDTDSDWMLPVKQEIRHKLNGKTIKRRFGFKGREGE